MNVPPTAVRGDSRQFVAVVAPRLMMVANAEAFPPGTVTDRLVGRIEAASVGATMVTLAAAMVPTSSAARSRIRSCHTPLARLAGIPPSASLRLVLTVDESVVVR